MFRAFLVLILLGYLFSGEVIPQNAHLTRLPPVPNESMEETPIQEAQRAMQEGKPPGSLSPLKELLNSSILEQTDQTPNVTAPQQGGKVAAPEIQADPVDPTKQADSSDLGIAPRTVQNFHVPELWVMDLGEALHLALQNNPDIAVQTYVPQMASTQVMQAQRRFDPRLIANHHWSQSTQTLTSNVTTFGTGSNTQRIGNYGQTAGKPDQLAIAKTLRDGTSLRAGLSTGYSHVTPSGSFNTLNPYWRTATSLEITSPLRRGRGVRINTMPIRIASAFESTTRNSLMSIVFETGSRCRVRILESFGVPLQPRSEAEECC